MKGFTFHDIIAGFLLVMCLGAIIAFHAANMGVPSELDDVIAIALGYLFRGAIEKTPIGRKLAREVVPT